MKVGYFVYEKYLAMYTKALLVMCMTTDSVASDWLYIYNIEITQPQNVRFKRSRKQRHDQTKLIITEGNLTKCNRKSSRRQFTKTSKLKLWQPRHIYYANK